jgi:hypothetical protein
MTPNTRPPYHGSKIIFFFLFFMFDDFMRIFLSGHFMLSSLRATVVTEVKQKETGGKQEVKPEEKGEK